MKLAIVNQGASVSVGAWRYLYMLVKNILKIRPDYQITIFVNDTNGIEEVDKLKQLGIKIKLIKYKNTSYKVFRRHKLFNIKFLDNIYNHIRKKKYERLNKRKSVSKSVMDSLDHFDAVFYSWPYSISAPNVSKPLFFIPHDFILSHSFGLDGCGFYDKDCWYKNIFLGFQTFVNKGAIPIVSSDFIKNEYNHVFPKSKYKPNVIYLSKFNDYEEKSRKEIDEVLKKYGIADDYILFANNNMPHKNLAQTIAAMYYVKQTHKNIKLIISGYQNQNILAKINTPYYADHTDNENDWDIKGIGLISDNDFSALMQGAKMCINASLCEAGAGSGLDAWSIGTPMVMSNIPAFKDQLNFLGVRAELFEPRESRDIARAINKLLDNPKLAKENAKISKQAMNKYSWNIVAKEYINVFEKYVSKKG